MGRKNGIKNIQTQYKQMVKRPDIKQWAKEFQSHTIFFESYHSDFEPNNLRALFKFYNDNKGCSNTFINYFCIELSPIDKFLKVLENKFSFKSNFET